jgi:hypothetical protein
MTSRRKTPGTKTGTPKRSSDALKVQVCGRDNAPVTMTEMASALIELGRQLKQYEYGYRVKGGRFYLPLIDARGQPVRINEANELTIYTYKPAAEEFGL